MEEPQKIEQMLTGLEDLPSIQLHELVDQLESGEQEDQLNGFGLLSHRMSESTQPPTEDGVLAAESFWGVLQKAELTGLRDLLAFAGVREELPQLFKEKVTVLAPTNAALAQLSEATRNDTQLLRQIIFAHMCSGRYSLEEMQRKNCAVAMAGQTHAVYTEGGHNNVGTARLGRTDLEFCGGVIHEVHSVLLVVQLLADCHIEQVWPAALGVCRRSEGVMLLAVRCAAVLLAQRLLATCVSCVAQVWKKTLQPAPQISICGGGVNQAVGVRVELEVHACLLHVATGQLVPEALVGHLKPLDASSLGDEKQLAFNELTVRSREIAGHAGPNPSRAPPPCPTPSLTPGSRSRPKPSPTSTGRRTRAFCPGPWPGDHQAPVALEASGARAARGRQPLPAALLDLELVYALVRDLAAHADLPRRAKLLPHAAARREELAAPAVRARAQQHQG